MPNVYAATIPQTFVINKKSKLFIESFEFTAILPVAAFKNFTPEVNIHHSKIDDSFEFSR